MQQVSLLLSVAAALRLVGWEVDPARAVVALNLGSQQMALPCPLGQVPAKRLHSRWERLLTDLPWGSWSVRLG